MFTLWATHLALIEQFAVSFFKGNLLPQKKTGSSIQKHQKQRLPQIDGLTLLSNSGRVYPVIDYPVSDWTLTVVISSLSVIPSPPRPPPQPASLSNILQHPARVGGTATPRKQHPSSLSKATPHTGQHPSLISPTQHHPQQCSFSQHTISPAPRSQHLCTHMLDASQ